MTWEETILYIQDKPEFNQLINDAYLSTDLRQNVENYKNSLEFKEILKIFKAHVTNLEPKILDIGSGNGISAISFALNGFQITALEPDPSNIVGYKAIENLKEEYLLDNIEIIQGYGESIPIRDQAFDIVFMRQCMHHANDLKKFTNEAFRVLKKGGIFLSVRDHVVLNAKDKKKFLNSHPLHKFYGGENAFTIWEYDYALNNAGFEIIQKLTHYDSVINYYPLTKEEITQQVLKGDFEKFNNLQNKYGSYFLKIYKYLLYLKYGNPFYEKNIPGRLYSFIAKK